jgi:dihydrofolate synthase / folylpolyglutamate synthase
MKMEEDQTYLDALEYLYSFVDFSMTRSFRYSADQFDLSRMVALMDSLGNPHNDYAVIHVAGTKGKGSTAALIASALDTAEYRVGFYSSPHLQDYNERIQVDGRCISPAQMVALVDEMKPHVASIERLTTFEITTALAFLYFARQNVDLAVIEVGLGGRLDATNIVEPMVSVITSLSYDHTAFLGNTLSEIAREKAGIIKERHPVVVSPQEDEARKTIELIAGERQSPLIQIGHDYLFTPWEQSLNHQSLLIWTPEQQLQMNAYLQSPETSEWSPLMLEIPLLGQHQVENAAAAYATLQIAKLKGLRIQDEDIKRGFKKTFWPGRFEVLHQNPPLIVDSAHNRDSALNLRLAIEEYLPGKPVVLLFGASEDKDVEGMFSELLPRVKRVICTESWHPRAMKADKLVELSHHFGRPAQAFLPVENALNQALQAAGDDAAIIVTGSLFIAAAVRECWQKLGNPVRSFVVASDN